MKYPTKQKRLIAIIDNYQKKFRKTAVTMDEVSLWAISNGLDPVPRRGDPVEECEAWERRLAEAMS